MDNETTRTEEQAAADAQLYQRTGVDPREIRMVRELFHDPETKVETQRLIAKKFPKAREEMPELRVRDEIEAAKKDLNATLAEIKAERDKQGVEATRLKAIQEAMDDPKIRLRPEEVEEVQKLMVSRFIGNYKDATKLYRAETAVAAPRLDSTVWMPGQQESDDEFYKKLWNTPIGEVGATTRDKLVAQESQKMLHEFQTGEGQRKYAPLMQV